MKQARPTGAMRGTAKIGERGENLLKWLRSCRSEADRMAALQDCDKKHTSGRIVAYLLPKGGEEAGRSGGGGNDSL